MTERLGDGLQNHLCQFDSDSTLHSPIAQLVEQSTVNAWVAGSSPARGATKKKLDIIHNSCYNKLLYKNMKGDMSENNIAETIKFELSFSTCFLIKLEQNPLSSSSLTKLA